MTSTHYVPTDDDYEPNPMYAMRMTEFLITTDNHLQRPRCSISPINSDGQDNPITESSCLHMQALNSHPNSSISFHVPKASKATIPAQSTPTKKCIRNKSVNFHSIIDLAQSSNESSVSINNHGDSGYMTSHSFNDHSNPTSVNTNLIFHLKNITNSMAINKENVSFFCFLTNCRIQYW